MLESGMGGERLEPRDSAVETSKRMGSEVDVTPPRERAVLIMPSEGSRPMTLAKCEASARAALPGPQPMSRRVESWPPVEVCWLMTAW